MQSEELALLVAQARAGNSQAFIDLVAAAQRDLRVFIATFAHSPAAVDAAFQATLAEARRQLNDCPTTPAFYTWLRQLAMRQLGDQLDQADRRAVADKDALAHVVIRAGQDALQALASPTNAIGQQVGARFGELDERSQALVNARYAEGRNCAAIGEAFGIAEVEVPVALFKARSALDGQAPAASAEGGDRLFPTLVEDHLDGAMAADARSLLAANVMKDLERCRSFVQQARIDLVLRALLGPVGREQVQEAVLKLGSGHESSRLMMGPPPVPAAARPPSGGALPRHPTPAARLAAAGESGRLRSGGSKGGRPSGQPRKRGSGTAQDADQGGDQAPPPASAKTPLLVAGAVVLVGLIALAIVWGHSGPGPARISAPVEATIPATPAPASAAVDAVARVVRASGGATLIIEGRPQPAAADTSVPTGSGAETVGTEASLALALLEAPVRMTLSGDGRIGAIGGGARTRILLQLGKLDLLGTGRSPGRGGVDVTTPQGRIAAEPGHCLVVCSAGLTRVEVSDGEAALSRVDGTGTIAVRAGQAATIAELGEPKLESASVFVRGIDFGGNGATIDGHAWLSHRDALGGGMTLGSGTEIAPPAAISALGLDFDSKAMLDTGVVAPVGAVRFSQVLPNGTYDILLWIAGAQGLTGEGLAIDIQGRNLPLGPPRARADNWRCIGPFRATTTNRRLDVAVSGLHRAHLAGAAFYAVGAIDGAPPAVVRLLSPEAGGKVFGEVPLLAAIVGGGTGIAKVEFYNGDTKLGEATASPYRSSWRDPPPGRFALRAVATDAAGVTSQSEVVVGEALALAGTGFVRHETWVGMGGDHVEDLTRNERFPTHPDQVTFETASFSFPENSLGDTGARLSGWLHPPSDGDYVFWIASDDASQLWLSTDQSVEGKRLVAQVQGWVGRGEWDKLPGQKSAPVALKAGRLYYVEALQKQAGGGSHLEVGWQLPGGELERPIPASRVSVAAPGPAPIAPAPAPSTPAPVPAAAAPLGHAASGPTLGLTVAKPPQQVDLGAEGTSDWGHWGLVNEKSFDRRDGPALIGELKPLGGKGWARYDGNFSGFSWTGGTPTTTGSDTRTGIFAAGDGGGFQLSVPADPSLRRLRVYLGGWHARGKFDAALSDGSAPACTDSSTGNLDGNYWNVYEVLYRAKSPFQTLTFTYALVEERGGGNVNFQAVSLAVVGTPVAAFVKGIDFSGEEVAVEGNRWLGQRQAEDAKEGLVVKGARKVTSFVEPRPAVDAQTKAMLSAGIAATAKDPLVIAQRVPNGEYDVYVWVMESVLANSRNFDLVSGDQALSGIGELPLNGWAKYGPLRAVARNGLIEIVAKPRKGAPALMGMAIYTAGAIPAPAGR